jgi:hypothetical protein
LINNDLTDLNININIEEHLNDKKKINNNERFTNNIKQNSKLNKFIDDEQLLIEIDKNDNNI